MKKTQSVACLPNSINIKEQNLLQPENPAACQILLLSFSSPKFSNRSICLTVLVFLNLLKATMLKTRHNSQCKVFFTLCIALMIFCVRCNSLNGKRGQVALELCSVHNRNPTVPEILLVPTMREGY